MTGIYRQDRDDGLVEIVIDRPSKLNALTLDMMAEMQTAIIDVAADPSAAALLLTGNGRAFCTGRDLSDAQPGEDARAILDDHINGLVRAIHDLEIPTVAAVRGPIMGVGLGIALACDIVVAGHSAAISSPFARLGAALDSGGHFFLARSMGTRRSLELIYSGLALTGSELVKAGLASVCVADEAVDGVARERALRLARGPTTAFKLQKRLIRRTLDLGLEATLAEEAEMQGVLSQTLDYAEGIAAFFARRDPDFVSQRRTLRKDV